jgi:hypothetical protein
VQTPTIFDAISNYWWVGGSYLPLPDISLDAQFGHITVSGHAAGGSVIAARAMYFFSKATSVYVTAGRVFNQRNAAFSIDGGVTPTHLDAIARCESNRCDGGHSPPVLNGPWPRDVATQWVGCVRTALCLDITECFLRCQYGLVYGEAASV